MIDLKDFEKVDLRIGTVISAKPFPEARTPAIKLEIDFGELGVKQSSAQITKRYTVEEMTEKQVEGVLKFPVMLMAGFISDVLVLGSVEEAGEVVLIKTDEVIANGTKITLVEVTDEY